MFPSIALGNNYDGCWPTWLISSYYVCHQEFVYFIFDPFVVFHCYWVWLLWYWFRGSCIYCHLCQRCGSQWWFHLGQTDSHIPLVVLWVLFQYCSLAYDGLVWKYLVWSFLPSFFLCSLCVDGESGFAEDCGVSSMGDSRCPMYSPLLNVICLLV